MALAAIAASMALPPRSQNLHPGARRQRLARRHDAEGGRDDRTAHHGPGRARGLLLRHGWRRVARAREHGKKESHGEVSNVHGCLQRSDSTPDQRERIAPGWSVRRIFRRMRNHHVTLALATIGVAFCLVSAPLGQRPATPSRIKALVGGTLIDGFGGRPVPQQRDPHRRRTHLPPSASQGTLAIPAGAEVISTEGMSVLPGLWDMHVHLMLNGHSDYAHWDKTYPAQLGPVIMPAGAKQLLLAGVTSARDLGAPLEASIDVRNKINSGEIAGATMYHVGAVHSARAVSGHRAVPLGRQRRRRCGPPR